MKYLFVLSVSMAFYLAGYSQKRFEKRFIRSAIGKDSITYSAKIPSYWIDQIKEALNRDTLFDWVNAIRHEKVGLPDSLIFVLTKDEKEHINHEFEKAKGNVWKNNVLKHSIAIDYDKLKIYKKEHDGKSNYNPDDYKNGSYMFAKPIFIRDKQVCFFWVMYKRGEYLRMYVMNGEDWELKFTILYGVLD